MKNSILIKQPISDGSSEYTVRIPNMTEWEQDETLATESYVDLTAASAASAITEAVTTLYWHSWYGGGNTYLNWISCNPNIISKAFDAYDQKHSLYHDLSRATSIIWQEGMYFYPVIAYTYEANDSLVWIIKNLTGTTARITKVDITGYDPESSAPAVYNAATMWPS